MNNLRKKLKYYIYTKVPGKAGAMPYFGTLMHFPIDSHLFYRTCREGVYECDIVNLIAEFVSDGGVVFDVGANIGLSALPILAKHSKTTIHSFEPSPNSYPWLEKTWQGCKERGRWSIANIALSNLEGEMDFYTHGTEGSAFDGLRDNGRQECSGSAEKILVSVSTIDRYVEENKIQEIDLIKIDVEGFETDVLAGASKTILNMRPSIFLEWSLDNLSGKSEGALLDIAMDFGMELYGLPNLCRIATRAELRLRMREVDCFMLIPADL